MGSEKRARQKKNRQVRLEEEKRVATRDKWRRRIYSWVIIAVLVVGVFVVGNLLTGGGNGEDTVPVVTTLPDNTGTTAPLPQVTDDTPVEEATEEATEEDEISSEENG
ncbi:MAG: hypothetical protein OXG89_10300 [bacterium]|nr:hypothetical protein [bacterium]